MTKSDLIDVLCETRKLPKGRAELLVHIIFDAMEAALKRGERIEIRGFGSFEIRNYKPYEGRNPRTGVAVAVKPKRLPFFKVGKELKERVNAGARLTLRASAKRAEQATALDQRLDLDGAPTPAPVSNTGPVAADAPEAQDDAQAGTVNRATA
jgi:integration host factor subunit beta